MLCLGFEPGRSLVGSDGAIEPWRQCDQILRNFATLAKF